MSIAELMRLDYYSLADDKQWN